MCQARSYIGYCHQLQLAPRTASRPLRCRVRFTVLLKSDWFLRRRRWWVPRNRSHDPGFQLPKKSEMNSYYCSADVLRPSSSTGSLLLIVVIKGARRVASTSLDFVPERHGNRVSLGHPQNRTLTTGLPGFRTITHVSGFPLVTLVFHWSGSTDFLHRELVSGFRGINLTIYLLLVIKIVTRIASFRTYRFRKKRFSRTTQSF